MSELDDVIDQDGQMYVCERIVPHVRRDGVKIELAVWRSKCAECKQPFTFKRSQDPFAPFAPARRCAKHKRPGVKVKKKGRF